MSCPDGRPSMSALAVKSISGSASTADVKQISLKLSLVAASISMRAGRSVRAQIIAESDDTSPDCTPCVTRGRSPDRISAGALGLVDRVAAVAEARVVRSRRRVTALPAHKRPDIKWPPPNQHGGWTSFLTAGKKYDDESMTLSATQKRAGFLLRKTIADRLVRCPLLHGSMRRGARPHQWRSPPNATLSG